MKGGAGGETQRRRRAAVGMLYSIQARTFLDPKQQTSRINEMRAFRAPHDNKQPPRLVLRPSRSPQSHTQQAHTPSKRRKISYPHTSSSMDASRMYCLSRCILFLKRYIATARPPI